MAVTVKAKVKSSVLIWARESAGLQVTEAARRLAVSQDRIVDWESGLEAPSIPQLRKMAHVYKRPLSVFFLQEVPSGFQVLRDFRRLPGEGLFSYSPELTLEIRLAQQRRQLAIDLFEGSGDAPLEFQLTANLRENPEEVGHRIREFLDVDADEQKKWRDAGGRTAFNGWRSRIEKMDILVFQATRIASGEASGFSISEPILPIIVVNRKDAPNRRTFSLFHEFAHLMLRLGGVSNLEADDRLPPEEQNVEIFCNQVAAATLMPLQTLLAEPSVREKSRRYVNWSDDEISELARMYSVSREAVLRRLLSAEMTTRTFYQSKRAKYLEEYKIRLERERSSKSEQEFRGRSPSIEALSTAGRPFIRKVLENFHQERLTLSEVSGVLGIRAKHVKKLEELTSSR